MILIRKISVLLLLSLAGILVPRVCFSEAFGNDPTNPVPPPAAVPSEEDDLTAPGQNFGFGGAPTNPPPAFGNPPPSNSDLVPPPTAGAEPPSPVAPSPVGKASPPPSFGKFTRPSNRGSFTPPPGSAPRTASTPAKASPGKSTPKLADYLELDSSVKGLEVKNFDLPDKDIKDVVTLISKWTGKNFILDNKVRGKITILGPSQVTLQEAYQAFLSALEANNLTTIQSGKFIRIIESAEARRAPVETYAGDYAPNTDQFITRIFQLKYINADEVQREFRDLTTRQGKLFAYEPTNSIIITDTGSNIRRIEGILQTLDVKSFETTLHVLKIKHTSAKVISDMLGEIYGEGKGGAAGGGPRSFRRSALERTRGGGIISKIIPDEATNSLVVLANSAGFQQLGQLVAKLDVKVTDTGKIHVYYCEYAKAEDLSSTLASLSGGGGARPGNTSNRNTKVTSPNTPGAGANAGGSTGPVTAELEGGVKVTSDPATNSLVITANATDYQTLKRVIRKLDIPRLQVFVETAILEVSLTDKDKKGVNAVAGAPNVGFAGGFVGDSDNLLKIVTRSGVPEGTTIPIFAGPSFPATFGSGTTATNITVSSFMGLLNLITTNSNTSILSTPQIIALDNEKAVFKVQDEIPVQTNFTALPSGTSTPSGSVTGSIERQKTGIDITLTPHVNAASKTIRLEIEQKVDSIKANTSVPTALQQVQVATTSRVTNTSVVVKDKDFVMLGGLMSDKVLDTESKVPLLGDIPILGWLFKTREHSTEKTNLIILLQPKIIGTSLEAANLIDSQLEKRRDFIDRSLGDGEDFQAQGDTYSKQLEEQKKRGRREQPALQYRNNLSEEEELLENSKVSSRSESKFDAPVLGPGRARKSPSSNDSGSRYDIPPSGQDSQIAPP